MEPNANLALWGSLVGTVLPLAISVVNQSRWSPKARGAVAFACCVLAAAGTAYFEGRFDADDVLSAFLGVFVAATTTYQMFWKPSGIAPAVEQATDVA